MEVQRALEIIVSGSRQHDDDCMSRPGGLACGEMDSECKVDDKPTRERDRMLMVDVKCFETSFGVY